MMKRIAALLTALCLLLGASALAEDALFTPKYQAEMLARKALLDQYGLNDSMLCYFAHVSWKADEGYTFYYFAEAPMFDYVMGRYTVTVAGDAAKASWSWDGREVPYQGHGLASHAWGKDQLAEIWLINLQTSDLSMYAGIASNLAACAGYTDSDEYITELPEVDYAMGGYEDDEVEYADDTPLMTSAQAREIAVRAVKEAFQVSDEQIARARRLEENLDESETTRFDIYEMVDVLIWDETRDWQTGDGVYYVTVNLVTGQVSEINYIDGIMGNG